MILSVGGWNVDNKLLQKARLLAKAGGREQAIPLLMHLVRVDPTDQEALDLLVDLLDEGQRRAALSAFIRESSQYLSSRLILESLSLPQTAAEMPDEEPEPSAEAEPPQPPAETPEGAAPEPFDAWVSEQALDEPASQPAAAAEQEAAEPAAPAEEPDAEGAPPEQDFLAELQAISKGAAAEAAPTPADAPLEPPGAPAAAEWMPAPAAADGAPEAAEALPNRTVARERLNRRRRLSWLIPTLLLLILAVFASIAFILSNPYYRLSAAELPLAAGPTSTPTAAPTEPPAAALNPTQAPSPTSPPPTPTRAPSATPAPTGTPAPTLPPVAGELRASEKDGMEMVYIPAGTFKMGWRPGDPGEFPEHTVTLDAFWIDQTEITNRLYAKCVAAGACTPPADTSSYKRAEYYGSAEFADYPVVYVNWQQAAGYCAWAGRRLPTEAEWEYAARGEENRLYPWGKQAPDDTLANFNYAFRGATPVGFFPDGASPFGVLDMAGNAAEWVADWYLEDYYSISPKANPQGPSSGVVRTIRGGSYANVGEKLRSSRRAHDEVNYTSAALGFRCAADAP